MSIIVLNAVVWWSGGEEGVENDEKWRAGGEIFAQRRRLEKKRMKNMKDDRIQIWSFLLFNVR